MVVSLAGRAGCPVAVVLDLEAGRVVRKAMIEVDQGRRSRCAVASARWSLGA